jgi:hypothetical protein
MEAGLTDRVWTIAGLLHGTLGSQFRQPLPVSHGTPEIKDNRVKSGAFPSHSCGAMQLEISWALSYPVRRNLVLDGGFNHALTSTSTRWGPFVGFTYLLPHRLWRVQQAQQR